MYLRKKFGLFKKSLQSVELVSLSTQSFNDIENFFVLIITLKTFESHMSNLKI